MAICHLILDGRDQRPLPGVKPIAIFVSCL
jgi:hypothetical protein